MPFKLPALPMLCLALALPGLVAATEASIPGNDIPTAQAGASESALIPARTIVVLEMLQAISTRTAKPGDRFELRVMQPLVIAGQMVIPAGSPAVGEVIHAQKSGVFGKASELLLTVRHVAVGEQKIPMRLFQPAQGKDRTGAALAATITTAVTVPVAGLFAVFIKGGQIELPAGTAISAIVARDTAVSLPAPLSAPSIDQGSTQ